MLMLAIDTCGSSGTVALCRMNGGDQVEVLSQSELPGKSYSSLLVLTVRELLERAGKRLPEVAAIVVCNGPGSFTGVRVGVSAAKGLAESAGLRVLAVSRLAVLAARVEGSKVLAAIDAGRGEFYAGFYGEGWPNRELLMGRVELLAHAGESIRFVVCEPAAAESLTLIAPLLVDPPTAADAVRFAVPRLLGHCYDDVLTLDGNYLRRSDAEIFGKVKSAAL